MGIEGHITNSIPTSSNFTTDSQKSSSQFSHLRRKSSDHYLSSDEASYDEAGHEPTMEGPWDEGRDYVSIR